MIYSVEISGQAEKDLKGIYEYISFVLLSPANAAKQLTQIITAISKLDYMPERYRKYEKEPNFTLTSVNRYFKTMYLNLFIEHNKKVKPSLFPD